ncbi:MAG TPA: type II toxin-antitoxin system prevent-host-death family antitoxin [Casimicrobiaceae bacterium]|jgi:prevent-host-death family protein|nr:type II toxin-antitoxin system prevent-host-death family antitoxin [Casimicrobiaceae bacterium]
MKSATISETKNKLSQLLARVKRGESVLILERDRPIARIVPVEAAETSDDERLAELERRGALRRAAIAPLKKLPPPIKLPRGVSLLEALLQDREHAPY